MARELKIQERNQEKLLYTGSRCGLRGAVLPDADLAGADLRRVSLHAADLRRADLTRADLSGTDLSYADLSDADLTGAALQGARLRGTTLCGATLRGCDFTGARRRLFYYDERTRWPDGYDPGADPSAVRLPATLSTALREIRLFALAGGFATSVDTYYDVPLYEVRRRRGWGWDRISIAVCCLGPKAVVQVTVYRDQVTLLPGYLRVAWWKRLGDLPATGGADAIRDMLSQGVSLLNGSPADRGHL